MGITALIEKHGCTVIRSKIITYIEYMDADRFFSYAIEELTVDLR